MSSKTQAPFGSGPIFRSAYRRVRMNPQRWTARADVSDEVLAAIGGEGRAGDEAGILRSEEDYAARDLFRFAKAADRDLRDDALVEHLFVDCLDHLGGEVDVADDDDGD